MRTRIVLVGFLFCLLTFPVSAAVTLPQVISDHMMFQRDIPVRVWGKANPGESVTLKFRSQTLSTKASAAGEWAAYLNPMKAGGPDDLRIEADNTIVVRDILVGEVWVASGQSNMQRTVRRSKDADQEIAAANYPKIRLFQVKMKTSERPLDDVEGEWRPCSPESVAEFTAVGYFFARKLFRDLGTPVAIIETDWGGTPAEAWTSIEALRADPALHYYLRKWDKVLADYPAEKVRYEERLAEWESKPAGERGRRPRAPRGPGHQHTPATLYNAMIAPIVPFNIRGAIWYQGESNAAAEQAWLYHRLFSTMITDWRTRWRQGDFPFGFVQLANFVTEADWPTLRESQSQTLRLRNTGMAVTVDIGNPNDIHPKNKQDVGKRLALWALAEVYGKRIEYSGPVYRQMTVEGNEARIWFDHLGRGLKAVGGTLEGFVVAGEDRIFHPATARIDGQTVVLASDKVADPKAVRYAWYNDPANTLRNADGLPASPFRTDSWSNGRMPEKR